MLTEYASGSVNRDGHRMGIAITGEARRALGVGEDTMVSTMDPIGGSGSANSSYRLWHAGQDIVTPSGGDDWYDKLDRRAGP
jgi:hypothetical protein